jgi:hypothetical protein
VRRRLAQFDLLICEGPMPDIVRTQPKLANRKLPEFVRCPICAVDFGVMDEDGSS